MCRARIIQQPAKWLEADLPLADVLMAIELRSARGFGVVAVPDGDVLQAHGGVKLRQRLVQTCFADDVIAGDVGIAGINASTHKNKITPTFPQIPNLR